MEHIRMGVFFLQTSVFLQASHLVMPSLFNFELTHIKLIWVHKLVTFKGFGVNYILLPITALTLGFLQVILVSQQVFLC